MRRCFFLLLLKSKTTSLKPLKSRRNGGSLKPIKSMAFLFCMRKENQEWRAHFSYFDIMKWWIFVTVRLFRRHYGAIIRTGITCKKISSYMRDSTCRWLIVENAKIFRSYVKHFWIFPGERNCTILLALCMDV